MRIYVAYGRGASVRYLKNMQSASGAWEMPAPRRPPMVSSAMQVTALAVYAFQTYGPAPEKSDADRAVARAVAWLEAQRPQNTQDRALRLLGLAWGRAKATMIAAAAKDLAAQQGEDGGWSQFPTMTTDA